MLKDIRCDQEKNRSSEHNIINCPCYVFGDCFLKDKSIDICYRKIFSEDSDSKYKPEIDNLLKWIVLRGVKIYG